jgi:anhydro-N-acetylmuramic acid kinase
MEAYKVLGVMSGTSLDGVDLALCHFFKKENNWHFEVEAFETVAYSQEWIDKLKYAYHCSGLELTKIDHQYGRYLGRLCSDFINNTSKPDIISSHGHTIFHAPTELYTLQIGNGAEIAAQTNIDTVCDFRTSDIALGGQGAPLVPIGDQLLFYQFDSCINIGGISNISFQNKNKRQAFDICAANLVFNHFAQLAKLPFDEDGNLGRKGEVIDLLYLELNDLNYYHQAFPKSLGFEFFDQTLLSMFKRYEDHSNIDILRTYYEHAAHQIASVINTYNLKNNLVSGGGAYNSFLIERINAHSHHPIFVPDDHIVEYKEALIFAFLGMLRFNEQTNVLASVTGAKKDHIGGAVYLGNTEREML